VNDTLIKENHWHDPDKSCDDSDRLSGDLIGLAIKGPITACMLG